MHMYEVGKPYHPNRQQWPEMPQLRTSLSGGVELVLFYERPTDAEVDAVRRGKVAFAWSVRPHTAFLAYRIADMPWSDCPYHPALDADTAAGGAGDPGLAAGVMGTGQLVAVMLVDAADGIIRAIRAVTWPPTFAAAVHDGITRLLQTPFDRRAHDRAVVTVQERTPSDLLAASSTAKCTINPPAGEE